MSKKEHTGLLGARLASADKFPEIDFSNLISSHDEIRANELKNLSDACTEFGFFFLAHSSISNDILQTVYREANRFHDLEDGEQKRAVHASHSPLGRGWWPLNEEPAYEPGTISYLESFDLGPDLPTLNKTARTGPNFPGSGTTFRLPLPHSSAPRTVCLTRLPVCSTFRPTGFQGTGPSSPVRQCA